GALFRFAFTGHSARCNIPRVGGFVNQRTLFPSLPFIFLVSSILTAQQTPDSTRNRLVTILHLPVLTSHDWQALFSEAESGNAEAQYWLGRIYGQGTLLPKDLQKSARWYQKSA